MTTMSPAQAESRRPPSPPHGVAISGIIFSSLYITSVVLIRFAVPADPAAPGDWLAEPDFRRWISISLALIPFAGMGFLWFMGAVRDHVGLLEDRFFSTVFLGSGYLFVALLFTAGAVAHALLATFSAVSESPNQAEAYAFGRQLAFSLMNTYSARMAAVFMFVTSSIGLRTRVFPKWVSLVGFAFGLVLLLVITEFVGIVLLFPCWVLLMSVWLLIADFHKEHPTSSRKNAP